MRILLIVALLFFLNSTYSQTEKISWKTTNDLVLINNNPFISSNGLLKLNERTLISFKEQISNISFSITNYGYISNTNGSTNRIKVEIYGKNNTGVVSPTFFTKHEHIEQYGSQLLVSKSNTNDILVYFNEPISEIEILLSPEVEDANFHPFASISEICWFDRMVKNPSFNKKECENLDMLFLVDNSSSIDQLEYNEMKEGIKEFLSKESKKENNLSVSLIEFGTKAEYKFQSIKLSSKQLMGGVIGGYLNKPFTKSEGITNWNAAFDLSTKADLIVLITDGSPNSKYSKKSVSSSLVEAVNKTNQLKKLGSRIIAYISDYNPDSAHKLMSLITNEYYYVNSFKEIRNLELPRDKCLDQKKDLFEIYPNPTENILNIRAIDEFTDELEIRVENSVGQTLNPSIQGKTNLYQIDMSNLEAGLYNIILIQNGEIIQSSKVITIK